MVLYLKENGLLLSAISSLIFNILGWFLNVSIARKTGSGWVETFVCVSISYSVFKLLTIVMKKESKISANSSFLVSFTHSLFAIVMDSFWYAFSVGLLFSKIFYYSSQSNYQVQRSNFFWLCVKELHKGFVASCIVAKTHKKLIA